MKLNKIMLAILFMVFGAGIGGLFVLRTLDEDRSTFRMINSSEKTWYESGVEDGKREAVSDYTKASINLVAGNESDLSGNISSSLIVITKNNLTWNEPLTLNNGSMFIIGVDDTQAVDIIGYKDAAGNEFLRVQKKAFECETKDYTELLK